MYDHYVDWLLKLSEMGDFDVMGHLTYPLRYMFERNQLRLDLRPYEEKFRQLFKNLTEKGRGIGMFPDIIRPCRMPCRRCRF